MNKLIYRKLAWDILIFFAVSSFSITLIVWVVQAVNLLDIVSEDGHSLKVYFTYTVLNLPKIFSRILIFIFFISLFYILNKYEENNEILVLWSNGIKKINFINFLFRLSITFFVFQLILNLYLVPYSQSLGRQYLKNSNVDFLPTLISEKKFIDVFKNLTIFIEEYNKNGILRKIYIKEKIDKNKSKIIIAEKGKIVKINNEFSLKLFNGGITNIDINNNYNLNFNETEYDLSKFSSKTITRPKIQEINSSILINCLKIYYLNILINEPTCKLRPIDQVSEEMFKRLIIPAYIFILSLISVSLIIKPKSSNIFKYHKFNIFIIGFSLIIFSQVSFKFIVNSFLSDLIVVLIPIFLIFIFYIFLLLKTKFKLNRL